MVNAHCTMTHLNFKGINRFAQVDLNMSNTLSYAFIDEKEIPME